MQIEFHRIKLRIIIYKMSGFYDNMTKDHKDEKNPSLRKASERVKGVVYWVVG